MLLFFFETLLLFLNHNFGVLYFFLRKFSFSEEFIFQFLCILPFPYKELLCTPHKRPHYLRYYSAVKSMNRHFFFKGWRLGSFNCFISTFLNLFKNLSPKSSWQWTLFSAKIPSSPASPHAVSAAGPLVIKTKTVVWLTCRRSCLSKGGYSRRICSLNRTMGILKITKSVLHRC